MTLILSGTDGLSDVDGSAATPAIRGTDANTGIFFPAADTIAFSEGGAEAMRIDSSGNVGIGTASPTTKLQVVGTATNTAVGVKDTTGYAILAAQNTGNNFYVGSDSSGGALTGSAYAAMLYASGAVNMTFATNSTERMRIDSSGNVGIGRTSPTARLHLSTASGNTTLTLSTNNNDSANATLYNDATYFGIASNFGATGVKVRFALATPDNAMTLDSNGNLFVGTTTTPSSSNAGIRMGPPGANFWISYNSGTTAYNQFLFGNANGQVGLIQTSGSGTLFSTSSDYRLKEDIQPMTGALAKVAALKPVTYKWKVDGSDGQGFIAHELQEVVAGCVTGEKDEIDTDGNPVYQGIDTSFLVATLTAAIQELKALVDTQASTITSLQEDVEALKVQP